MKQIIVWLGVLFVIGGTNAIAAESPFCPDDTCGGLNEGLTQVEENVDDSFFTGDFTTVVLGWVSFGLAILSIIAFIAFLYAGALYITAFAGGEENAENAKKTLVWTTIGIILVLTSYTITRAIFQAAL